MKQRCSWNSCDARTVGLSKQISLPPRETLDETDFEIPKSRGVCRDSLEHPRWQVMAIPLVTKNIRRKYVVATSHGNDAGRCHYCDVLMDEMALWEGVILVHRNSRLELGLHRKTIN